MFRLRFVVPLLVLSSVLVRVPDTALAAAHARPVEAEQSASADSKSATLPAPGTTVERDLAGGGKHAYSITLKADDLLKLVVEQKGIDVVVRLIGPDGKTVVEVDSPNGTAGPEPLSVIVDQSGDYVLEIEALEKNAPPGRYELKPQTNRPSTEPERVEVAVRKLNGQALQLTRSGKYDQARPIIKTAIEKAERVLGPDHLLLSDSLGIAGSLDRSRADYASSDSLFARCLTIREKALGPDHPLVADVLNNRADLYRLKGDLPGAEAMYLRALAVREKALGPNHLDVAQSLNNLALIYDSRNDFVKAEGMLLRALAIREKVLGPDKSDVAQSLNNLADLYREQGNYAKAEPLYLRALAVWEKTMGPDHADTGYALNNLAYLYFLRDDPAKAESFYFRALAVWEKAFGPDHPNIAIVFNNLGDLYRNRGDYDKAEDYFQRSLKISEKVLGPDHELTAAGCNNLALVHRNKGDHARAEPLFQRAVAAWEKSFGPNHPNIARGLDNLAWIRQTQGDPAGAVRYLTRSNDIVEKDLVRNLISGSESRKMLYLKRTERWLDQTVSMHVQGAPSNEAALQAALTVILRRKGRSLDAMTNSIGVLRDRQDDETRKLLDEYQNLTGQISTLTLRGAGLGKLDEHLVAIRELERRKDDLEDDITRRSGEFQAQAAPITLEAVRRAVPAAAVLVEYVVYQPFDPRTIKYGKPRYAVYLLDGRETRFADLGEAESIDEAATAFRRTLADPTRHLSGEVDSAARTLDRLVMSPVRKLVGKAEHLLISPDGALNLIPFAALIDEHGKYLVEDFTLTYLTSGRDLLRLGVKVTARQPAVIVANPDYARGNGPRPAGESLKPLSPLRATAKEGSEIRDLLTTARLVVEREATESFVKQVERPEILHIATHGCFLEDVENRTTTDTRNIERLGPADLEQIRIDNPLLRSCLFFAGANHGGDDTDDGMLTALEAARLDLWGTKLVVLSACETGLGETRNGEGVYGLRRALVLAGSEAQLMSLWAVSDKATRELMSEYYRRLKAGESRSEALRSTQLKMLADPKRRHPFYWAAFIQSGAWTALDEKP